MKRTHVLRSLLGILSTFTEGYLFYKLFTGGFSIETHWVFLLLVAIVKIGTMFWMGERLYSDENVKYPLVWMSLCLLITAWPLLFFENTYWLRDNKSNTPIEPKPDRFLLFSKRWKVIHSIVFMILSGLIIVVVAELGLIPFNDNWKDKINHLLVTLGSTILIAGVSSAILQLFSSIRFFQKDLVKTFYDIFSSDAKYLETIDISQLRKNWEVLSTYLYKKKFSELSSALHNIISEEYFPTNHPVYYKDYCKSMVISLFDDKKPIEYVRIIETIDLQIIANTKDEDVFYDFGGILPCIDANTMTSETIENEGNKTKDTVSSLKVTKFTINGEDFTKEENLVPYVRNGKEIDRTTDLGKSKFMYYQTTNLNGFKVYKVHIVVEKICALKTNQLHGFKAVRLISDMTLSLEYPKELNVEFWERGTVKNFETISKQHNNSLVLRFKGLILPHQGFVVQVSMN